MSPRAAWRLEQLGFAAVYDYTGGKADWIAAGLPTEAPGRKTRAGDAMRSDAATARLDEPTATAAERARSVGWDLSVVTNEAGIVAGVVAVRDVRPDERRAASEVMHSGPATVRADEDLGAARRRMVERGVDHLLVTTPDGELLGVLEKDHGDG